MDKLLVRLNVPVLQQYFDVFVPRELPISALTKLFSSGVAELSDGRYSVSGQEMLTLEPGTLLHPEHNLMEYGIHDGDMLILI